MARELVFRLGQTWKLSVLKKIEDTFPWLCIWLAVGWLAYLLLQSSLTPPVAVLCLGCGLWLRNATARLRNRGGPIALLPAWAQSVLLETRPLDAMAAVAVVVDAQKGIGLLFHLLAALRLDERERATFVDQLPARVRSFVLAPGLLHVMPRSLRACVAWDDAVRDVAERRHLLDRATEPQTGETATTDVVANGEPDDRLPVENGQAPTHLSSRGLRLTPSLTEALTAVRDCVPYLRRREPEGDRGSLVARRPGGDVARVVAEFNPWPTLLRVVSRRVAAWLRARLTFSTLSISALGAGGLLGAQLALSPASRRIAANSARLGIVCASASALLASVAAFAALHADRVFFLSASGEARAVAAPPRRAEELSDDPSHPTSDDDDDDERPSDDDLVPSPWPAAAAMLCTILFARSLRISSRANWVSPWSEQLARRLFEAFMRIKTPFE